ncbi:Ku protein [Priestia megaterium]|nr:Ku protein [Priestia megaterium]
MLHTAWKGKIHFGLIDIPIKLHGAIEEKDIKLRTLHTICHTPIQQEKRCPHCEREVEKTELVKGYETSAGHFIALSEEELEELKKRFNGNKTLELIHFISLDDIDPIYFDKTYYISPNDTSIKAYQILIQALQQTNQVGIANVLLYSKQQIAIIRPYHDVLALHTLHFEEEIRSLTDVPNISLSYQTNEEDVQVAIQLINRLSTSFQPAIYKNEYRDALQELIQQKMNNEDLINKQDNAHKDITKLMEMLKLSIDQSDLPSKPKKRQQSLKKKA